METVIQLLRDQFKLFGEKGISLVLVCAAILFWIIRQQWIRGRTGKFMKYEILFFILCANPFGYNNISTFWMQNDYWKVFMVLLPAVCIAFSTTELICGTQCFWQKGVLLVAFVLLVGVSMNFKFSDAKFALYPDCRKVDAEIVEVDDIIKKTGINTRNMIAPRKVCAQIREIDPKIELLYGEDLIERMINKTAESKYEEEQQFIEACMTIVAVPSAVEHQIEVAVSYDSNCILLENAYDDEKQMTEAGFSCCGRTESYAVYIRQ
ncbi:MAG: hypothetical protein ACLT1B_00230 [Anaerobutyricum hallii]